MPHAAAPKSIQEVEDRIHALPHDLPKRMQECADYFTTNFHRIAVSTVADLAKGSKQQPSAIIRFCKILGFTGFSQMQRLFRENYAPPLPDYETRLQNLRQAGNAGPIELLAEFAEAGRKSLENTLTSINPEALQQAVAALSQAEMIHVIGLRRAFPVASYLAYAFEKMDVPALLHDGAGQLDRHRAMRSGDALLAVTFAPHSGETLHLTAKAKEQGLQIVALTDAPAGPFREEGTLSLYVPEVDFGAFRSLSASLTVAITLAVAIGTERKKEPK